MRISRRRAAGASRGRRVGSATILRAFGDANRLAPNLPNRLRHDGGQFLCHVRKPSRRRLPGSGRSRLLKVNGGLRGDSQSPLFTDLQGASPAARASRPQSRACARRALILAFSHKWRGGPAGWDSGLVSGGGLDFNPLDSRFRGNDGGESGNGGGERDLLSPFLRVFATLRHCVKFFRSRAICQHALAPINKPLRQPFDDSQRQQRALSGEVRHVVRALRA